MAAAWHFKSDAPNTFVQLSGFGGYHKVYGGRFDVKVGNFSFEPSKDSFRLGTRLERLTFRRIELDLGFLVERRNGQMQISTDQTVLVPLARGLIQLRSEQQASLGGPRYLRLFAELQYRMRSLSATLKGRYTNSPVYSGSSLDASIQTQRGPATLSLDFGFGEGGFIKKPATRVMVGASLEF